LTRRHLASSVN